MKSWLTSLAHCSADQSTRLKFHPVGEFSAEISILAIMLLPFAVSFCIFYIYYSMILNKLFTIVFSTHLSRFLFCQNVGLLQSLLFFSNLGVSILGLRKRQGESHLRKLMKKSPKIKGAY